MVYGVMKQITVIWQELGEDPAGQLSGRMDAVKGREPSATAPVPAGV